MVVRSFVPNDRNRSYATYTLNIFRKNIQSFMIHDGLNLEDTNFIDESNVLDFVSDVSGTYFYNYT